MAGAPDKPQFDGHDAKGRFLPGNRAGGGRKRTEFILQDIIDERIPRSRWGDIIEAQVQKALGGDTNAAKFLAERRFGEPQDPGEKEALDRFFDFLTRRR